MTPAAVLREAASLPPGATFVSAEWRALDHPPRLVSLLFTRKSPVGIVLPHAVLVDRTCLGVKNAFVATPMQDSAIQALVRQLGAAHEGGMASCELHVAQSIVFHALDYAASLGFPPHPDFHEILVGPRPAVLLDTPFARPDRPTFMAGPDDPVDVILAQLSARVGAGNFTFIPSDQAPS